MERYDVPGLALAVVRGNSVLLLRGWGLARGPRQRPGGPARTLFRLASLAKLFVATAAMQRVERGALDLAEDVNRYLDGWGIPATYPEPVTLRTSLLTPPGWTNG